MSAATRTGSSRPRSRCPPSSPRRERQPGGQDERRARRRVSHGIGRGSACSAAPRRFASTASPILRGAIVPLCGGAAATFQSISERGCDRLPRSPRHMDILGVFSPSADKVSQAFSRASSQRSALRFCVADRDTLRVLHFSKGYAPRRFCAPSPYAFACAPAIDRERLTGVSPPAALIRRALLRGSGSDGSDLVYQFTETSGCFPTDASQEISNLGLHD